MGEKDGTAWMFQRKSGHDFNGGGSFAVVEKELADRPLERIPQGKGKERDKFVRGKEERSKRVPCYNASFSRRGNSTDSCEEKKLE